MITRASRISTRKVNILLKSFVLDQNATIAAALAKVSREAADRYYRHWRELIFQSLERAPRFFGEVEMDTSFVGGRGGKRLREALKHIQTLPHREYILRAKELRKERKIQVFGILQRGGDVYAHIIKKADKRTLGNIVRLVVEEKSIVYTDKWRGFADLRLDGYTHKDINHSEMYSDKKGNHINGIEQFWSSAKRRLSKFNGISRLTLPLHIKESEWRYNHRDQDLLKAMKKLILASNLSQK